MLLVLKILRGNRSGFSLAEILIATGIIVLLSGVVVSNYRAYDTAQGMRMAANVLGSDIRRAQSYGLNLKEHVSGVVPSGGWGIEITSQNPNNEFYKIFAELTEDGSLTADEEFEKIPFAKPGVGVVSKITIDGAERTWAYLIFKPPGSTVRINATNPDIFDGDEMIIKIGYGIADFVTITVNKFGLIEVN